MNLSNQGLRILVVDDSPLSRKLLEYALTDKSDSVVFAKDGREAIGLFGKRPADMVISDWVLPDVSGLDLCRKIRAEFPDAYTYLVLLTSNSDSASVAEGLAAGADDYVTKPFDREALLARVGLGRRVIEMHREIEAKTKRLLVETRTNPLTGLANRRAVEEWTIKQLAGAARHGYDLWIVLADLESHHEVNDLFGRSAGDAMIKAFAEVLKKNTRVSDLCGHLGGGQFVLVLTHIEDDNVQLLIDRLRGQMEARHNTVDGAATPLAATFGAVASRKSAPLDFVDLLRAADAALVEAKRVARKGPARELLRN